MFIHRLNICQLHHSLSTYSNNNWSLPPCCRCLQNRHQYLLSKLWFNLCFSTELSSSNSVLGINMISPIPSKFIFSLKLQKFAFLKSHVVGHICTVLHPGESLPSSRMPGRRSRCWWCPSLSGASVSAPFPGAKVHPPPGSHQHSTAQFHLASPCQPYPDITVALPSPHTRGAHSTQFDSVGRTPRRSLTYANLSASLPPCSGTGLLTVLMH